MGTPSHLSVSEPVAPASQAVHERDRLGSRLAGVVLLAGSIRDSELSRGVGRSLLDLPLAASQSLLGRWCDAASHLAEQLGIDQLHVRVMLSPKSRPPVMPRNVNRIRLTIETDPRQYRGTGGLLRDLADAYDGDERLLVSTGTQVLTGSLSDLAMALARAGDVALLTDTSGEAAELLLASCRALSSIRGSGFVDLKEQALPDLANRVDVRVVAAPVKSVSIRTLAGYVSAVRWAQRAESEKPQAHDPFAEDWFKTFGIVEDGGSVNGAAILHDSVVLSGGHVGVGAVVVRSVVCPGASVAPGSVVCDKVFTETQAGMTE